MSGIVTDISNVVSNLTLINTGSELIVNITKGTDNGGIYTCFALNAGGFGYANITLYVSPSLIIPPEDDHITNIGDTVMLTCIADSFPAPTYQWQRMNAATKEFEDLLGQTESTLTTDKLGTYRCIAFAPVINETISGTAVVYG